jgi:rhamnose utilization protein RhaD (predicted bifunctional aldolase and dehydrogenase)
MSIDTVRGETLSERVEAGEALLDLARALGTPPRSYAILGEGNVSLRLDDGTFLIKASGTSLSTASDASFVRCDLARVLELVHGPSMDDEAIARALRACQVGEGGARGVGEMGVRRLDEEGALRPSVETGMHAVLLAGTQARCIAHTHPIAITGILCSSRAEDVVAGALFPDQIVVCGAAPMFLPYVDPGVPLARALAAALTAHVQTHGAPPKAIYLRNHGFVALGRSEAEALAISDMAVKAAEVLALALASGGPRYLPEAEARRIAGRSDEHYRQRMLGLSAADREEGHDPVPGG